MTASDKWISAPVECAIEKHSRMACRRWLTARATGRPCRRRIRDGHRRASFRSAANHAALYHVLFERLLNSTVGAFHCRHTISRMPLTGTTIVNNRRKVLVYKNVRFGQNMQTAPSKADLKVYDVSPELRRRAAE